MPNPPNQSCRRNTIASPQPAAAPAFVVTTDEFFSPPSATATPAPFSALQHRRPLHPRPHCHRARHARRDGRHPSSAPGPPPATSASSLTTPPRDDGPAPSVVPMHPPLASPPLLRSGATTAFGTFTPTADAAQSQSVQGLVMSQT
jgi:hypothetical protein